MSIGYCCLKSYVLNHTNLRLSADRVLLFCAQPTVPMFLNRPSDTPQAGASLLALSITIPKNNHQPDLTSH